MICSSVEVKIGPEGVAPTDGDNENLDCRSSNRLSQAVCDALNIPFAGLDVEEFKT